MVIADLTSELLPKFEVLGFQVLPTVPTYLSRNVTIMTSQLTALTWQHQKCGSGSVGHHQVLCVLHRHPTVVRVRCRYRLRYRSHQQQQKQEQGCQLVH